jgi:hypothetical protein
MAICQGLIRHFLPENIPAKGTTLNAWTGIAERKQRFPEKPSPYPPAARTQATIAARSAGSI